MDSRFRKINRVLSEYSKGNFENCLNPSARLDDIDAFMAGVNMLGEELKATTISRNYFNNIFHSVSDMVIVLDRHGFITDMNLAVSHQLGYTYSDLKGQLLDRLLTPERRPFFMGLERRLKTAVKYVLENTYLHSVAGNSIPVQIAAGNLFNEKRRRVGFLLTIKDMTLQMQTNQLIIRTIIDAQEKERQRLAKDIHDSLGQQLSAIKFYISTITSLTVDDEQRSLLMKSNEALTNVLADMRNICFHLMPKTLEEFGLVQAVQEVCNQLQRHRAIQFHIRQQAGYSTIEKAVEIDVYRIIQEFISNAIKHGKASRVAIYFKCTLKHLKVVLKDNGVGFDVQRVAKPGLGLQNMHSRARSHGGDVKISSSSAKGTTCIVRIPIPQKSMI